MDESNRNDPLKKCVARYLGKIFFFQRKKERGIGCNLPSTKSNNYLFQNHRNESALPCLQ